MKPDILKALKSHKDTRKESILYLQNFICNMARGIQLMHNILKEFRSDNTIFQEACRNYIISMVSCLETFYRDLYVFVLESDISLLKLVLPEVKAKSSLAEIHKLLSSGFSFSDIASTNVNFQNLGQVESSFSMIFRPNGYLDTLDKFEIECLFPSKQIRSTIQLPENWQNTLAQLFIKRHEYVHNANSQLEYTATEMAETETLVLIVGQLTSHCISQKFGGKGALMLVDHPAILLIEDLLRDDWEPATKDDPMWIGIKRD